MEGSCVALRVLPSVPEPGDSPPAPAAAMCTEYTPGCTVGTAVPAGGRVDVDAMAARGRPRVLVVTSRKDVEECVPSDAVLRCRAPRLPCVTPS